MNILKIKNTMNDKGIPPEKIEQFVFPETIEETPEEKIAFVDQMDKLLTKDQILAVMEEQGCNKNEPSAEKMMSLNGKSIRERIRLLNAMDISEAPYSRINNDGTLSIFWNFKKNGKFRCVCPIIEKLEKPTAVSLTYCGCCSGHVKYHYENFLGVKLRLLETVSSPISSGGENHCEHLFEIL